MRDAIGNGRHEMPQSGPSAQSERPSAATLSLSGIATTYEPNTTTPGGCTDLLCAVAEHWLAAERKAWARAHELKRLQSPTANSATQYAIEVQRERRSHVANCLKCGGGE
ncbi:MAG: hypothetical protein HIU93_02940 [Acidobacteria bacterium]|nr:hypothetical protein [Acidobacteriota bacterium]MBW4044530.1 hypothetical protein [Acidobacteriota bacterium]